MLAADGRPTGTTTTSATQATPYSQPTPAAVNPILSQVPSTPAAERLTRALSQPAAPAPSRVAAPYFFEKAKPTVEKVNFALSRAAPRMSPPPSSVSIVVEPDPTSALRKPKKPSSDPPEIAPESTAAIARRVAFNLNLEPKNASSEGNQPYSDEFYPEVHQPSKLSDNAKKSAKSTRVGESRKRSAAAGQKAQEVPKVSEKAQRGEETPKKPDNRRKSPTSGRSKKKIADSESDSESDERKKSSSAQLLDLVRVTAEDVSLGTLQCLASADLVAHLIHRRGAGRIGKRCTRSRTAPVIDYANKSELEDNYDVLKSRSNSGSLMQQPSRDPAPDDEDENAEEARRSRKRKRHEPVDDHDRGRKKAKKVKAPRTRTKSTKDIVAQLSDTEYQDDGTKEVKAAAALPHDSEHESIDHKNLWDDELSTQMPAHLEELEEVGAVVDDYEEDDEDPPSTQAPAITLPDEIDAAAAVLTSEGDQKDLMDLDSSHPSEGSEDHNTRANFKPKSPPVSPRKPKYRTIEEEPTPVPSQVAALEPEPEPERGAVEPAAVAAHTDVDRDDGGDYDEMDVDVATCDLPAPLPPTPMKPRLRPVVEDEEAQIMVTEGSMELPEPAAPKAGDSSPVEIPEQDLAGGVDGPKESDIDDGIVFEEGALEPIHEDEIGLIGTQQAAVTGPPDSVVVANSLSVEFPAEEPAVSASAVATELFPENPDMVAYHEPIFSQASQHAPPPSQQAPPREAFVAPNQASASQKGSSGRDQRQNSNRPTPYLPTSRKSIGSSPLPTAVIAPGARVPTVRASRRKHRDGPPGLFTSPRSSHEDIQDSNSSRASSASSSFDADEIEDSQARVAPTATEIQSQVDEIVSADDAILSPALVTPPFVRMQSPSVARSQPVIASSKLVVPEGAASFPLEGEQSSGGIAICEDCTQTRSTLSIRG